MQSYLDLLRDITENGSKRMDRTGTGTHALFGRSLRFDLKNNQLPLVTTRKIFTRGIIEELLWMIQGSTTNRTLIDKDVHIWDEWGVKGSDVSKSTKERTALREKYPLESNKRDLRFEYNSAATAGDLGLVYGGLWRRWPTMSDRWIQVEMRKDCVEGELEIPVYVTETSKLPALSSTVFPQHWENQGVPFTLLGEYQDGKHKTYVIQFDKSRAVKRVSHRELLSGAIHDAYRPMIYQVGCIGQVSNALPSPLYSLWARMMARCYDTQSPHYRFEGKKGYSVHPRWRCYENFYRDVKALPNYETWVVHPDHYELSTLYYGAKQYGPQTTVLLTHQDIQRYRSAKMYKVTNPKGIVEFYAGDVDLADGLGIKLKELNGHLNGSLPLRKLANHDIEKMAVSEEGKLWRRRIYVDQLADLIEGLRKKPFSRRHIVTAWNPAVLPNESKGPQANVAEGNQALTACHCMFQFFVRELSQEERREMAGPMVLEISGTDEELDMVLEAREIPKYALSCQLYQRSADVTLGSSFNIASYAIFTAMIAQVVGMVPDEFVYTLGDAHIYLDHLEGVKEQLSREPLPGPKLLLNPAIKNIDDFTVDDIRIVNYKSHGKIDYPISV